MISKMGHRPVMVQEVVRWMQAKPDMVWLDGTVGAGGHVAALLDAISGTEAKAWVLGCDRDGEMLMRARQTLHDFLLKGWRIILRQTSYTNLPQILAQEGVKPYEVDGVFLDLGLNSYHVDDPERGFSFLRKGPLDMRYDSQENIPTALEFLQKTDSRKLTQTLRDYGEEKFAAVIIRAVKKALKKGGLQTTHDLAQLVYKTIPKKHHPKKIHPATRTFQALRIAVNDELKHLETFLEQIPQTIEKPGGRIGIISFHSLEDRMVKRAFQNYENPCTCPSDLPVCQCGKKPFLKVLTRKPIQATDQEAQENPRSRSAKFRVAEVLGSPG